MVRIDWAYGPAYPMGIQDSALGVIGNTILSAGGFTRHPKDITRLHPDTFGGEESGFTNVTFALDLSRTPLCWERIADMPAAPPRQGTTAVVVGEAMYVVGGFSYADPFTYRETFKLERRNGEWVWEKLACELSWPVAETGAVAVGKNIYVVGGCDYFRAPGGEVEDLLTEAGREGNPVGNGLFVLDTEDPHSGWQRLSDLPGTARMFPGAVAVGDLIYVLQGAYAPLTPPSPGSHYFNVVDSWVYDTIGGKWSRLSDAPEGSNRSAVLWRDRAILLIGAYRYPQNQSPDGTRTDIYTNEEKAQEKEDPHFWKKLFATTVLSYDIATDEYTVIDSLLERTSTPMVAIKEDRVFVLGGEGGKLWHPDAFQIGTVREQPS
ncbi:MAG: hypothetical protein V1800_07165 [Candidatus Latescibacterota bacterium]